MRLLNKKAFDWFFSAIVAVSLGLLSTQIGLLQSAKLLPLLAVPLAGFVVAAFNLRFRMLDTVQKLTLDHGEKEGFKRLFRRCKKAINISIVCFVLTTFLMAVGSVFAQFDCWASIYMVSVAWYFFVVSLLKFIRILETFGTLEDFNLSKI